MAQAGVDPAWGKENGGSKMSVARFRFVHELDMVTAWSWVFDESVKKFNRALHGAGEVV